MQTKISIMFYLTNIRLEKLNKKKGKRNVTEITGKQKYSETIEIKDIRGVAN